MQPDLAGPLDLARPMLTALRRSPRAQAFHSSLDSLLAELNTFEERFKVLPRLPLLRPLPSLPLSISPRPPRPLRSRFELFAAIFEA